MNYLIQFIVLLISYNYCNANKEPDKYCEIQDKICTDLHPLCKTFQADGLQNQLENAKFYEMDANDINFVVTNINRVRTMIAKGEIKRYKPAANLRVVKWSADFVRLAEMKSKHGSVCTKLSLNSTNELELEMEQFVGKEEPWNKYFYQEALSERIYNDSFSRSPWRPLERAEFDTIGCALYHDVDEDANIFECFTNKMSGPETYYKEGKPCSQCVIDCSKEWPSLCDTLSSGFVLDGYHITIILVLSCITMTIMFLAGMVYIFRLIINKKSKGLSEVATEVLYSEGSLEENGSQIKYSVTT